ncbi:MAG: hypothetical protein B6245_21555 [Desulfobacteraceae bacterium 4572_88]|nr:MAG: hypothetical protein B6245_21555 [Desulfobacteraceae bacterium 4572_88]
MMLSASPFFKGGLRGIFPAPAPLLRKGRGTGGNRVIRPITIAIPIRTRHLNVDKALAPDPQHLTDSPDSHSYETEGNVRIDFPCNSCIVLWTDFSEN